MDEWELYDLEADPEELENVYYDPAYAKLRYEFVQKLGDVQRRYGDSPELARQFIREDSRPPEEVPAN